MNTNPWLLERTAEYERERIQRDLKQIRLEEKAMRASRADDKITKSRSYRPRPLVRFATILVQWIFSMVR